MRITLVGFGLMASSIAMAVKQSKTSIIIRAVSSEETISRAKKLNLADEYFTFDEINKWVSDSDLILLCTPIFQILNIIRSLRKVKLPNKHILVSDIGSTKVEICKAGLKLPEPFIFVGSHPMAGSEKHFLENGNPEIFKDANWFVCLSDKVDITLCKSLFDLISIVGAKEVLITPEEHDSIMSWVSHMPQLLSSTLAANIPDRIKSNHIGPAFKDMTRIAASNWKVWQDIVKSNRKEILSALINLRDGLNNTINAVEHLDDNPNILETIFNKGTESRMRLVKG